MLRALDEAQKYQRKQLGIDILTEMKREASSWMETHPWRPFQQQIWNILESDGNKDYIYWLKDEMGGTGKSTFKKIWFLLHQDTTLIFTESGKRDILHIARKVVNRKVVIFDFPMGTDMKEIDYTCIENLHDNSFTVAKFDGEMHMGKKGHVLVIANQEPVWGNIRASRWRFGEIHTPEDTITWKQVGNSPTGGVTFTDVPLLDL